MARDERRTEAVRDLIGEARRLTVLVRQVAAPVLARHDLTIAGRAVLEELAEGGPETVPVLARQNLLTRQAVQRLVDDLRDRGFVAPAPNPAHRRSSLWAITQRGRRTLRAAAASEAALLDALAAELDREDVTASRETIRALADRLARDGRGGDPEPPPRA